MSRGKGGLNYEYSRGEFDQAMHAIEIPMTQAAIIAIAGAAEEVKLLGRADIAAAGFGLRWQNAFRVTVYKNKGLDAAAFIYHKIGYAGVFEHGPTTIAGKPKLWLPLSSTPKKLGNQKMTPKLFHQQVNRLFPMTIKGKAYLAARVSLSKSNAARRVAKVTNKMFSRGGGITGKGKRGQVVKMMPVFHAVDAVTLSDRLHIAEIVERTAGRLGQLYLDALQGDE